MIWLPCLKIFNKSALHENANIGQKPDKQGIIVTLLQMPHPKKEEPDNTNQ